MFFIHKDLPGAEGDFEAEGNGLGFQQLPKDLANVNAIEKKHVWSLLLYEFNHDSAIITLFRFHRHCLTDS